MGYLHRTRGFTLIESLVAIAVFAMLGLMTTTMMIGTLQGAKKAAAIALVKNEGGRTMSVINQMLKYASDITDCSVAKQVTFVPRPGESPATFICAPNPTSGYIAFDSAHLTSAKVSVTSCDIACKDTSGNPATAAEAKRVDVNMTIEKTEATFASEKATTIFETQIGLRNREQ